MSLGIPAVVSPVGVNSVIVSHGENGFVCNTPEEWKKQLLILLQDHELRKRMGQLAQQRIRDEYSVSATRPIFISLFS